MKKNLLIQACKDLHARDMNHGSWPEGKIPDSFYKIKELHEEFINDDSWVLQVEQLVQHVAVSWIAETQHADDQES